PSRPTWSRPTSAPGSGRSTEGLDMSQASAANPAADFNPIAWGQFYLRGGWRSFWPTTVGYTALVGALMLFVVRLNEQTPGAVAGMKTTFTGLQAGLLVLFVSTRVSTAIR